MMGVEQSSGGGLAFSLPLGFVPPRGFVPAEGVRAAWASGEGPFPLRTPVSSARGKKKDRRSLAQKAGLRYEKKVHRHLQQLFPDFRPAQWLRYDVAGQVRWCQTDGLLVLNDVAVIFEVKYTFTCDAWFQLRGLYQPVVKRAFYTTRERLCIICRNFDPSVRLPEKIDFVPNLSAWVNDSSGSDLAAFSWRG